MTFLLGLKCIISSYNLLDNFQYFIVISKRLFELHSAYFSSLASMSILSLGSLALCGKTLMLGWKANAWSQNALVKYIQGNKHIEDQKSQKHCNAENP